METPPENVCRSDERPTTTVGTHEEPNICVVRLEKKTEVRRKGRHRDRVKK